MLTATEGRGDRDEAAILLVLCMKGPVQVCTQILYDEGGGDHLGRAAREDAFTYVSSVICPRPTYNVDLLHLLKMPTWLVCCQ